MGALLIFGFMSIAEKIEKKREQKREAKRLKQLNDQDRYEELEKETRRRLSRTQSGNIVRRSVSQAGSEDSENERMSPPPPKYDDVVTGTNRGGGSGLPGRSASVRS